MQKHYIGLVPIPKPKTKLANTFAQYRNDTETTLQRENLVRYLYQNNLALLLGIFFIIKGALKTKIACKFSILLDYFWRSGYIFMIKKTYILPRSGKHENNLKKIETKKGFGFGKKDFGFWKHFKSMQGIMINGGRHR